MTDHGLHLMFKVWSKSNTIISRRCYWIWRCGTLVWREWILDKVNFMDDTMTFLSWVWRGGVGVDLEDADIQTRGREGVNRWWLLMIAILPTDPGLSSSVSSHHLFALSLRIPRIQMIMNLIWIQSGSLMASKTCHQEELNMTANLWENRTW